METSQILSLIIEGLFSSGIIVTLLFFNARKRKENAEASRAEHNSDAEAIANAHNSALEWKAIAEDREAENRRLNEKLEKVWEHLRKEQSAHAKTTRENAATQIQLERKEPQICRVRGCKNRNPPSDY